MCSSGEATSGGDRRDRSGQWNQERDGVSEYTDSERLQMVARVVFCAEGNRGFVRSKGMRVSVARRGDVVRAEVEGSEQRPGWSQYELEIDAGCRVGQLYRHRELGRHLRSQEAFTGTLR